MKVIINADDYGISRDTNNSVSELATIGTISSTSVMVNMPYAAQAKLLKDINNFGVGLHFNLTQGVPVSNKKHITSLLDHNGEFYGVNEFIKRIKNKRIKQDHILIELSSQMSLLKSFVGYKISHIDSHQDINKYISSTLTEYVKIYHLNIGLRWYNKIYLYTDNKMNQFIEPNLSTIIEYGLRRVIKEEYFRYKRKKLSKYFRLTNGMLYSRNHNIRTLLNQLAMKKRINNNINTYEIMVHPATSTNELTSTGMREARVEEYNILKSNEFIQYAKNNIITNYNNI